VLFFAHQCNSTVTIVGAMKIILNSTTRNENHKHLYFHLATLCCKLREKAEAVKDVGSGEYNRHQPSSTTLFTEGEINKAIMSMKQLYAMYELKLKDVKTNKLRNMLQLFDSLQKELISEIMGLGAMRSMHMILLSSLVGLLPLEYYVNVPMHMSGGPKTFLTEMMNYSSFKHSEKDTTKKDKLLAWTVTEIKVLQELFTKEFTPNMFENVSCMIGRKSQKYDVFYFLPWYDIDKKSMTCDNIQLCFRVNGKKTGNWVLEAFDGNNIYTFLSSRNPGKNIVKFARDGFEIADKGHIVEVDRFKQIYKY
jgi:hypothetical protein